MQAQLFRELETRVDYLVYQTFEPTTKGWTPGKILNKEHQELLMAVRLALAAEGQGILSGIALEERLKMQEIEKQEAKEKTQKTVFEEVMTMYWGEEHEPMLREVRKRLKIG
jgi:ABC-type branched-subunit amino acid transport system ATPase component